MSKDLGKRLDHLLRAKGLSQSKLGRLLGVGRQNVNNWIHGKNEPVPEIQVELAKILGVEVWQLHHDENPVQALPKPGEENVHGGYEAPSYARETPYDKLISDLRADAIRLQESERVLRNRNHELEIELEIMKRRLGIGYFAQAPAPILAAEIANRLLELDPAVSLDEMSDEIRDLLAARSAWNDDQFRSELPLSHQPIVDKFYEVSRQEATPQGRAARLTQEAMAKLKVAMELDPSVAEKLEEIVAPGTVSGATILHSRQRDRSYPGRDIEQSTQSGVHEQ